MVTQTASLLHEASMSIRILYCMVADEAVSVTPDTCTTAGYLSENSKEAVSEAFEETSKIFILVDGIWEPFDRISPDMSLENAKFLVVTPISTSGVFSSGSAHVKRIYSFRVRMFTRPCRPLGHRRICFELPALLLKSTSSPWCTAVSHYAAFIGLLLFGCCWVLQLLRS